MPSAMPTLNWKELAASVAKMRPEVEGLFVEKVIVPERPRFPQGYVKGEWMIRLRGGKRGTETGLLFSIRARNPYLALVSGKGPRAASGATHSPFSLAVSAQLRDARLNRIEALPSERIVVLWFAAAGGGEQGLVILLIPAAPEALLVKRTDRDWPVQFRSRVAEVPPGEVFRPPAGARPPGEPEVRAELVDRPAGLARAIEAALESEAFGLRLRAAERELRAAAKQARDRVRQGETARREAEGEPDWQRFGDLMKTHLGDPPPIVKGERAVLDYASGNVVRIPSDPKLSPIEQVEKFFSLAKRRGRRAEEASSRIEAFTEQLERAEAQLAKPPQEGDWPGLEAFERAANILPPSATPRAAKKQLGGWSGKTFLSRDGLAILVGRSRDENLELTFKRARGNDLWLHVRGRPGAHVVVLLQPGKSAPLETLLDAATLAVYYSGGESWGKTEVDYAFKKYVKRIRDSTEASYANNKTLIIEPERERLQRLLGQQQ